MDEEAVQILQHLVHLERL